VSPVIVNDLKKHLIVCNVVGLESSHIFSEKLPNIQKIADQGAYCSVMPVFPAVTSTVQASLLTGKYPNRHGIISNGTYDRSNFSVSFWEQSSSLVESPRIWDILKKNHAADLRTCVLFWQNTLYANSDIILTPRPIHLENRTIMWCYSKPPGYYEYEIIPRLGDFDLSYYWGPLASSKSSEWIAAATVDTFEKQRPSLLLTYFPHVDYSAQRFGKTSSEVREDLLKSDTLVGKIIEKVKGLGLYDSTEFVILSEYPFNDVTGFIDLNRLLRDEGLIKVRQIGGYEFIDLEYSEAFAMVDHQVAHIYVKNSEFIELTKRILHRTPGIDAVLSTVDDKHEYLIDHPRSGDLIAISERNKWFTYYWWYDDNLAPPFAHAVDIHRKPGYDPLELFFDQKKRSIPLDPSLVKSSHGHLPGLDSKVSSSVFITSNKDDRVASILTRDSVTSADIGSYLIGCCT
jgi:predicted AlkP superfamily pyrophosphatase or phosphodiesterase